MATGIVLARYQSGSSASPGRAPDLAGPLPAWFAAATPVVETLSAEAPRLAAGIVPETLRARSRRRR